MTQDIKCTNCNCLLGGLIVEKDLTKLICAEDKREFVLSDVPIPVKCPQCGKENLVY